jgi:hypothetical protein
MVRTVLLCLRCLRCLGCLGCLGCVVLLGCAGPTQPTPIVLGQAFDLRPRTSATLADGLQIRFDGVRSDSRCPMDAICVWAGDAVVAVSITPGSGAGAERELHTQPDGSQVEFSGYGIKLTGLAPYPRAASPIRSEDYVATLTINTSRR